MGSTLISFRVPRTTADVLEYRAFILSMEDATRLVRSAAEWAAAHIEEPADLSRSDMLINWLEREFAEDSFDELLELCGAIAQSACMPQDVLDDIGKMLDLQNDIDPKWRPKPKCDCPRCRRPDIDENPPGVSCMYDDLNPIAVNVAAIASGVSDGQAQDPYFLTQIRSVFQRSTSRIYAQKREEREEKEAFDELRRQHGANI